MALNASNLPLATVGDNKFSDFDEEDRLCWRCGEPELEHSWYGGRTYCDSAWVFEEDLPDPVFHDTQRFEPNPPAWDDAELVRVMQYVHDTRDWML